MPQGKLISEDLAWVIVHMRYVCHLAPMEISRITSLSVRAIRNLLEHHHRTGCVKSKSNQQKARDGVLSDNEIQFIQGCLEHSPDAYLNELQAQLHEGMGCHISRTTIYSALKKLNYTHKRVSRTALECSEVHRLQYMFRIGSRYNAEQLIFVDESAFDRRTAYRQYGWAKKGQRAYRTSFYVRGKRYSILPAISIRGILWCHIIEGPFNTVQFRVFIDSLLDHMQPFPAPNSVIVMDNASIHKDPSIVELVESRGMRVEFLPAYSPDFNPIEEAFSVIKAHIRCNAPSFSRSDATGTDRLLSHT